MEYLKSLFQKKYFYLCVIVALSVLITIPWLGLGYFYTRGEPREALVAMAMLQQHNFILPEFQGEIAFKPPFLHWLIALFSLPQGYISEFTSRLPSALAACIMFISFFCFMSKRMNRKSVFLATLLLMSCFEIHRAAMTCRVDMLLTSLIVMSLLVIYRWSENGYKGLPILLPLLVSGAILTKGPIGVILPCFSLFVYMFLQKENLLKIAIVLTKIMLVSFIIPLCWYIAAYNQGGDIFLNLVLEENFGRFMGKMSYESHENGSIYNVYSLLAGLLPWTLLMLFSLFTLKFGKFSIKKHWFLEKWENLLAMDKVRLFSLVAAFCIFVFYCIPKSKRSVYTMPMYPFTCLFLAEYFYYIYHNKIKVWKAFAIVLISLSFTLFVLLFAIRFIDLSILGTSRSALRIISQMSLVQDLPLNAFFFVCALPPICITLYAIKSIRRKGEALIYSVVFIFFGINITLDSLILPCIKNSAPDYYLSKWINEQYPEETIYSFKASESPNEPFYVIDFYLNNRVEELFDNRNLPEKGYVMVQEDKLEYFERVMDGYVYKELNRTMSPFTSVKRYVLLYEFEKE